MPAVVTKVEEIELVFFQQSLSGEAEKAVVSDNYMVEYLHLHDGAGINQVARQVPVILAWLGVARRVVVHEN